MFREEADYKVGPKVKEDSGYMLRKRMSTTSLRNGTSKKAEEKYQVWLQ